tara:strand:+ start:276 stop:470 length:195 start_codon:yes stop_codon:yes gene_type:complete
MPPQMPKGKENKMKKCKKQIKDCNNDKCHYHNPPIEYFINRNKEGRVYTSRHIWTYPNGNPFID